MDELAGKTVVVTGGSRGVGMEIATAFAMRGANLVIASRKLENCASVARRLAVDHDVRALPFAVNVSDWTQCHDLVEAAYAEFGHVDVLVNNAGLSPPYSSLVNVSEQLFDKVVAVNLRGPFRLAVLIGQRMFDTDGGTIINVGSVTAMRPRPDALPYAAAKAGLHVVTEGLAQAFGPKVRVNTIQPGPVLTDIATHWREGVRQEIESNVALGRCAQPAEIVGAAVFFATSASSFCTGALLRVDGGWR